MRASPSRCMARQYKETIYINRAPNNPYKGWGWIDVETEVVRRYGFSTRMPQPITLSGEELEEKLGGKGGSGWYSINPPGRGRTGGKKFVVNTNSEFINLSVQKSLTIEAVCAWVKTWASSDAKIITPGKRTISLAGEPLSNSSAFIYFVLNADSNAIKIGKARDLDKCLKSLQTSSPATLQLLKAIQITCEKEAAEMESKLHRRFTHLRITGE